MSYKFTTTSVMEFDTKEELEAVIAMMPWDQDDKDKLWESGEHVELEEVEHNDVTREVAHTFTIEEE